MFKICAEHISQSVQVYEHMSNALNTKKISIQKQTNIKNRKQEKPIVKHTYICGYREQMAVAHILIGDLN